MSDYLISSMLVCPDAKANYPRIVYGSGIYLFDEKGNKYLDASGGAAAVSNIGHGNKEVAEAIARQAAKVSILPTHYFSSDILEEYLKDLVEFAPKGFARAWTVTSGTEAVENAIKVAIQYHQLNNEPERYKVIGRWNSYHGNSIFTLDVGGMVSRRKSYQHLLKEPPHIPPAYCYRCPFKLDPGNCHLECASILEETIQKEGAGSVAAFVVEPVVGAALGSVPAPAGYFQEIRRICSKYGILMIVDEVMTGFGRTGKNFGIENWNVTPDIIAAGKGIASGYFPLSAVIVHERVAKLFTDNNNPFLGGHTYACNPLGAAAGKCVLDYIRKEKLVERASILGKVFIDKLNRLSRYDIVGDIRGLGLLAGFELVRDKATKAPYPPDFGLSKKIGLAALKRGVILYPGRGSVDGVSGDHVLIAPPLIITEEELEYIVHITEQSIEEVMEQIQNGSPAIVSSFSVQAGTSRS